MDAGLLIQLAASVLTIASVWAYGNKWKLGPILGLASEGPWIAVMVYGSLWGLIPVSTVMLAMHARNLWKWNKS